MVHKYINWYADGKAPAFSLRRIVIISLPRKEIWIFILLPSGFVLERRDNEFAG